MTDRSQIERALLAAKLAMAPSGSEGEGFVVAEGKDGLFVTWRSGRLPKDVRATRAAMLQEYGRVLERAGFQVTMGKNLVEVR